MRLWFWFQASLCGSCAAWVICWQTWWLRWGADGLRGTSIALQGPRWIRNFRELPFRGTDEMAWKQRPKQRPGLKDDQMNSCP